MPSWLDKNLKSQKNSNSTATRHSGKLRNQPRMLKTCKCIPPMINVSNDDGDGITNDDDAITIIKLT